MTVPASTQDIITQFCGIADQMDRLGPSMSLRVPLGFTNALREASRLLSVGAPLPSPDAAELKKLRDEVADTFERIRTARRVLDGEDIHDDCYNRDDY